jgi:PfaD family protein|tara:strand:- start:34 stop:1908 length:1875 start_codon:yes stop_codon:yes gene_type:complete
MGGVNLTIPAGELSAANNARIWYRSTSVSWRSPCPLLLPHSVEEAGRILPQLFLPKLACNHPGVIHSHIKMDRISSSASSDAALGEVQSVAFWEGDESDVRIGDLDAKLLTTTLRSPVHVVFDEAKRSFGLAVKGQLCLGKKVNSAICLPLVATLPAVYPEWLGDRAFQETHSLRFNYVGGAMARGIGSTALVVQLAHMGALGFFGAAGLSLEEVETAIDELSAELDPKGLSWGSNLIHTPNEPDMEDAIVDLYLRRNVRRVSASAYMRLTKAVVRYAVTGLTTNETGVVSRRNYLFAKISREEVASHFLSPAPDNLLKQLVAEQAITEQEALLAARIPLSEDVIVESDSGGHTDNRPLNALFPAIMLLRDRLAQMHGYHAPIRLGAAGSLGTPVSVAAAFALGASFVLLGTVHQAAVESGISEDSRLLLAQAGLADVAMTASADMFELGVKVQVLKRGTLMAARGNQLYELYSRYNCIDDIPPETRSKIEKQIFRCSLDEIWESTQEFFGANDPEQLEKANRNPKHKMALIFRWYVGNSSRWPISGQLDRQADYQIWCGPAMGAFNSWVKGSFLEDPQNRTIQQIALNLLEGATIVTRANQLRSFGLALKGDAMNIQPQELRL